MKKLLCAVLALLMIVSVFAGCGGNKTESATAQEPVFEGELSTYLEQLTDGAVDPEMALDTMEITNDLFSWMFFADPVEGAEAAVRVPIIGSIPFEVGLIRLNDSQAGEALRDEIEEKADPRKWICVEAEKTAVVKRGNLILLAMGDADVVDGITANFMALE